MVAGVLLGIALLANLGPGRVPDVTPPPVHAPREAPAPRSPAPSREPTAPVVPAPMPAPESAEESAELDPEPAETHASLIIDLIEPDGRPAEKGRVMPVHCPGLAAMGPGRFRAPPGPCSVRAVRRDGALFARSPVQTAELVVGEVAYLQLELEPTRTGGIGVRFQPMGSGMQVLTVVPDTPAFHAGLEQGDVIVEVNGLPTDELSVDEFVQTMTGPEGSEVEFTIEYPGDEGPELQTLRVTRKFLDG